MVGHPGPRGTSCWHPLRLIPHVGDLMRQEERLRRCHSVARAAGRAPREQRAQRQVAGCSRRLDRFRECGYELGANVERLSISFDQSANVRGVVVHGRGGSPCVSLVVPGGSLHWRGFESRPPRQSALELLAEFRFAPRCDRNCDRLLAVFWPPKSASGVPGVPS